MACARLAAALAAALAVALPAANAHAAAAPKELHGFTLRATESVSHTFSRTPSFAWSPVPGALTYDFELSTSKRFNENGTIYSTTGLKSPAAAIPISIPWISGNPYSLYAHVRAVTRTGETAWSTNYGFNMRWPDIAAPVTPAIPGLLRWTAVPGANAYRVWLPDLNKQFTVRTNMADEREFYTFHQDLAYSGTVHWRVRALRLLYGSTDNALPAVSFGPWSSIYTSFNPPFATAPLATISNVVSDATTVRAHEIMPAFQYTSIWNTQQELYRVIVFTDEDCLNAVFRGAITGAPVFVPRPFGPFVLPGTVAGITSARTGFLPDATPPYPPTDSLTYDDMPVGTNELDGTLPPAGGSDGLPLAQVREGAKVDLWDSDWPGGRYYWTVMPVIVRPAETITTQLALPASAGETDITVVDGSSIDPGDALKVGSPIPENAVVKAVVGNDITLASGLAQFHSPGEDVVRPGGAVTYQEAELTQDACAAHRLAFGKTSDPVVASQSSTPFVSGLSPQGKLTSATNARPQFYGQPLTAWLPIMGADQYEVQWSKKVYPWKAAGSQLTWGTSMTLPLTPGTWFYRVRGIDFLMMGSKTQMSWSDPVRVVVTKPRFRVVH
jgi:hypothetical protein